MKKYLVHKVIFYPLGNADSYLIRIGNGKHVLFDYAAMKDDEGKFIDLPEAIKSDIGWPNKKLIEVVTFTHNDRDHVHGASDFFWLEHAKKYQGEERVKIKVMWVPAALIVETGLDDPDAKIIRAEARYRLKNKKGIRVFGRPVQLKDWLKEENVSLSEVEHLITDAGTIVPDMTLENDKVEFFVHSPFAEREGEGLKDRNSNSIVLQARFEAEDRMINFILAADTDSEMWDKIVAITRSHDREDRLNWDLQKVAHHCSYKALNKDECGKTTTTPTENVQWLLNQGNDYCRLVITSLPVPDNDTTQPPHIQAYRRYKKETDFKDGETIVTMENPSKKKPERTIIQIDGNGVTNEKKSSLGTNYITSTIAPRVG